MQCDMLLLAERLVVAIEAISQDVKNMSAYVYDISCSVTCLLNEKKEKECISVVAHYERDNPAHVTSAPGQKNSAEMECSGQYELMDKGSSSHIAHFEHGEGFFESIASTSFDSHRNLHDVSSVSNPIFTEGIKLEEQSVNDVGEESCEMQNVYGSSENIEGVWLEVKSEVQSLTDRQDEAYDMQTTTSNPPEQSTYYTTPVMRMPEDQARTHQIESAEDTSVVHLIVESGERPYKCSVCEKSFKARCNLQAHERVHSGERPFQCQECGRAFTQGSALVRHMRCHTGERPFKCNVCGKAFSRSTTLTLHMHCHTGERPYSCYVCGYAFSDKTNLRHHMRTHTGERPYSCNECGHAFSRKKTLKIHMQTHTGERPYCCNECGHAFSEKKTLNIHMRTHTGEKPYMCTVCGREFRHRPAFTRHMRTHSAEQSFH